MARFEAASPTENTLMVFAHTDQLGMIVTKIEPTGFLRVVRLGGVPERVLPGSVVKILAHDGDVVTGVMGTPPHHLTPEHMKYTVPPLIRRISMWGHPPTAEVHALGIHVGDHVAYEPRFERLAGNRVAGTSIDDRGGCAVLVGLAEHLAQKPAAVNVVLVATVQGRVQFARCHARGRKGQTPLLRYHSISLPPATPQRWDPQWRRRERACDGAL